MDAMDAPRIVNDPDEEVWLVDCSKPKPDQITAGPMNASQRSFLGRLRKDAAAQARKEAERAVAAARKNDATLRVTAMARDGNQLCQDLLDIQGIAWRQE
jgi:hypothetical protein